jgi:hypothetical protein
MPTQLAAALLAAGIPVCLGRLWWIWWQSMCGGCGEQHKVCACPAGDHLMRPRR